MFGWHLSFLHIHMIQTLWRSCLINPQQHDVQATGKFLLSGYNQASESLMPSAVRAQWQPSQMPYDWLLSNMQRSKFCLFSQVSSSRLLTNAASSGCIPVFIGMQKGRCTAMQMPYDEVLASMQRSEF